MEIERSRNKTIKCSLIGCGNIGSRWDEVLGEEKIIARTHIKSILNNHDLNLHGVYDLDTGRSKEAAHFWNVPVLNTLTEVTRDNTDLVVLATPPAGRLDTMTSFAERGIKFFFSEKPLADNFSDAKKFMSYAHTQNLKVIVNYSRTFCPEYLKLTKEIESGKYGDFQGGFGYYAKGLKNNGSHVLSLLSLLFGGVSDLKLGDKVDDQLFLDPTYNFSVIAQGKQINVHGANYNLFSVFEFDLLFTKGKIRILDSGATIEKYVLKPDDLYPTYNVLSLAEKQKVPLEKAMSSGYDEVVKYFKHNSSEIVERNFGITENLLNLYNSIETKEK